MRVGEIITQGKRGQYGTWTYAAGWRSRKHEDPAWGACRVLDQTSQSCTRFCRKLRSEGGQSFQEMRDTKQVCRRVCGDASHDDQGSSSREHTNGDDDPFPVHEVTEHVAYPLQPAIFVAQ